MKLKGKCISGFGMQGQIPATLVDEQPHRYSHAYEHFGFISVKSKDHFRGKELVFRREKLTSLLKAASSASAPFCLDTLPEIKGSPVLLVREGFAEIQPEGLPSSPPAFVIALH